MAAAIASRAHAEDFRLLKAMGLEEPGIRISDKSGRAGVAYWINSKLGLEETERVGKDAPAVEAIFRHIASQYEAGRVAAMSDEEMAELIAEHIPALAHRAQSVLE